MSDSLIHRLLDAVSRRRRIQYFFESLFSGLFYGALAATGLLIARFCGFSPSASPWPLLGTVLLGAIAGCLIGCFRPLAAKETARKVDAHYRLKDRFLTALQILAGSPRNSMERLQLEDTTEHARNLDAREVVPFRRPRQLVRALATVGLAVAFCLIPPFGDHGKASQDMPPLDEVLAVVEQVDEEIVEKVEELLKENPEEKELKPLLDELKQLSEQLENKAADPKEALATLSQMEASLAKAINEFNIESVDASMQEVAETLTSAEATRAAGQALKSDNYSKAADELEKSNFAAMSKPERNAVAAKLKQNAAAAGLRRQEKLGKLLDQMSEQIEKENASECKSSACELAGLCRKQGLRKGICQGLGAKLGLLSLCKSQCSGACQGNKNGGNNSNLSDRSSNSWGTGDNDQPQGDRATDSEGNLQREQITGIHGAGPSDIETTNSDEKTDATTTRAYKDVYRDFQKISEAVLESEPIPLGQRQMIRTYFERIRPKD